MTVDIAVGIEEDVAHLPEMLDATFAAATEIANQAIDIAPVVTGEYRDGIGVQHTPGGARVFASDYKSAWVEFGVPSDNEPPQFVLRRAAELAGYGFVKSHG